MTGSADFCNYPLSIPSHEGDEVTNYLLKCSGPKRRPVEQTLYLLDFLGAWRIFSYTHNSFLRNDSNSEDFKTQHFKVGDMLDWILKTQGEQNRYKGLCNPY